MSDIFFPKITFGMELNKIHPAIEMVGKIAVQLELLSSF
jgi:hypothetical protein